MATPSPLKYYQHCYGGIYTVDKAKVINTVDNTLCVVYTCEFPFERQTFVRPYDEWCEDGRFKEIFGDALYEVFQKDRKTFQEEITAAMMAAKRDK
jgi:hypothetical protein